MGVVEGWKGGRHGWGGVDEISLLESGCGVGLWDGCVEWDCGMGVWGGVVGWGWGSGMGVEWDGCGVGWGSEMGNGCPCC